MVQIIKYPCCGKVFAACKVPDCYEDADWQKQMRASVKKGATVEMVHEFEFEKCTCVNKWMKPEVNNQLALTF